MSLLANGMGGDGAGSLRAGEVEERVGALLHHHGAAEARHQKQAQPSGERSAGARGRCQQGVYPPGNLPTDRGGAG